MSKAKGQTEKINCEKKAKPKKQKSVIVLMLLRMSLSLLLLKELLLLEKRPSQKMMKSLAKTLLSHMPF